MKGDGKRKRNKRGVDHVGGGVISILHGRCGGWLAVQLLHRHALHDGAAHSEAKARGGSGGEDCF